MTTTTTTTATTTTTTLHHGAAFKTALTLGSVPAICMLIATCIGLGNKVPRSIAGALQHFAAGVLLCTIGTELLPEMVNATGWAENTSMGIGFFLGMSVLVLLGIMLPETHHDDDDNEDTDDEEEENDDILDATTDSMEVIAAQHAGRLRQRKSLMTTAIQERSSFSFCTTTRTGEEEQKLLLEPNKEEDDDEDLIVSKKPFPTALVLALAIDSAMDGLLIGIASAAGPSAGPMMSASLSVEMSFLGLTLATALHGYPISQSMPCAILGPLVLVLGAGLGGSMANMFKHDPILFVGMLSFGTSALLFMVAEELLLEAHEQGGQHVWWVDVQLYTGFFCSILAKKFVPSE